MVGKNGYPCPLKKGHGVERDQWRSCEILAIFTSQVHLWVKRCSYKGSYNCKGKHEKFM